MERISGQGTGTQEWRILALFPGPHSVGDPALSIDHKSSDKTGCPFSVHLEGWHGSWSMLIIISTVQPQHNA